MNKYKFSELNRDKVLSKILIFAKAYTHSNKELISDHEVYDVFTRFFSSKPTLSRDDIILCMSVSYSWMPTIPTFDFSLASMTEIERIVAKAKKGKNLDELELETLMKVVNNSIVGTSKFLHFISPNSYPILDSRVCEFLFGKNPSSKSAKFYLEYKLFMEELLKEIVPGKLRKTLKFKYDLSELRLLEFCMYGSAVKMANSKKVISRIKK